MKRAIYILTLYAVCLCFSSCLQRYNNYGVAGTPVTSEDGRYVNCIVAENEAVTHQENGGFIKTTYSTSYWLKQYEASTGKLTQKRKILSSAQAAGADINCFGSFDNKIWLYVNGIRSYDMNSLEEVNNEENIAALNGMKKTIFPVGERLVNAAVEKGYINFTADNGEEYRLLLKQLKIINREELKDEEDAEQRLRRFRDEDEYGVRCDTFSNRLFCFAKDSAAVAATNINSSIAQTSYRMYLFTADYSTHKLGNHTSLDYYNIQKSGPAPYLNPCFLKNITAGIVIHPAKPVGFLVIHQDVLGSHSKAIIARIDTSGKKIWETATGVSTKIESCVIRKQYCIITTNKDYMLSPHIGKDALCIVDTETGNVIKPLLNE